MGARKAYMAPFWNMIVLIVVPILYYSYFIYTTNSLSPGSYSFTRFYYIWGTYSIVLIGETIVYWYIRKWTIRKLLIWFHIGCLYFALILIPVVYVIAIILFSQTRPAQELVEASRKLVTIRTILFWSSVFVGHVFFVAAIIEGFKNRKKHDEVDEEIFDSI